MLVRGAPAEPGEPTACAVALDAVAVAEEAEDDVVAPGGWAELGAEAEEVAEDAGAAERCADGPTPEESAENRDERREITYCG